MEQPVLTSHLDKPQDEPLFYTYGEKGGKKTINAPEIDLLGFNFASLARTR